MLHLHQLLSEKLGKDYQATLHKHAEAAIVDGHHRIEPLYELEHLLHNNIEIFQMLLVLQLLLAELDLLFRVCRLKNVKVDSQLLFSGLVHVDVLKEPLI